MALAYKTRGYRGARTFKELGVLFVCVLVWIRHNIVVFEGVNWERTSKARSQDLINH